MNDAAAFSLSRHGIAVDAADVHVRPLAGGLESATAVVTVARETAPIPQRFIVKELRGAASREAQIYEFLWSRGSAPPTVRVLGHEQTGEHRYLVLEEARSIAP